jgi:hypothetical protein
MNTQINDAVIRQLQRAVMVIVIAALAACSGGDDSKPAAANPSSPTAGDTTPAGSSGSGSGSGNGTTTPAEQPAAAVSLVDAASGAAIAPNATESALSKIVIAGIDLSDATVEFATAQNTTLPMIPDQTNLGQFWTPLVAAPTTGNLSVLKPGAAAVNLPLTLAPLQIAGPSGQAIQSCLQSSLAIMDAKIAELGGGPPNLLLTVLQAARALVQQELAWVNSGMQNNGVVIAQSADGATVEFAKEDLAALDQIFKHSDILAACGSAPAQLTRLSPLQRLIDFFLPSAFAQTSDEAALISKMKASAEGLALTESTALNVTQFGTGAFRAGANTQAVQLLLAGLNAAHYGNALAMILDARGTTFSQDAQAEAVSALKRLGMEVFDTFKDAELANLATEDSARSLASAYIAAISNPQTKNLLVGTIKIVAARNAGLALCPLPEMTPAPSPNSSDPDCINIE